jgi:hypothetical protein
MIDHCTTNQHRKGHARAQIIADAARCRGCQDSGWVVGITEVTAAESAPSHHSSFERGNKVDYQVAAPTETSTPTMHRATIAQQRVRMEGWRTGAAWLKGRSSQEERKKNILTRKGKKERKTYLTHTGPLMEGPRGLERQPDRKIRSRGVKLFAPVVAGKCVGVWRPLHLRFKAHSGRLAKQRAYSL